ncbi:MAG: glycosyltransferase family 2 protein [Chloroflexota bacterium]
MTADTPLVTIVTPSYNQAAYLEHTLRSVLLQDYPAIEYLVVDGASTDASPAIIQRWAGQAPERLRWWVSEPDGGQAEAINKGFRRARGQVLAWLNSDDVYLPGAVRRAVAALQANPTAPLVFGDALTVDAPGRPLNRLRFGDWGLDDLLRFRVICQPAVFMRREALEQTGWVDPSYHFLLDHQLWVRLARLAAPVYIGHGPFDPLAAARHHPAAKNLTLAGRVGEEIERLLAYLQTQPDLQPRLAAGRRQIYGGAARLNARYLLEGGLPGPALRAYLRALSLWPAYAARHTHRMLYALACLAGLQAPLDRRRAARDAAHRRRLAAELRASPAGPAWRDWPGVSLDD